MPGPALADQLDALTAPGELVQTRADGAVVCHACAHRCLVRPGRRGICQVRFNEGGQLRVPFGYVAGLQNDPVEKKPFFHLLPGAAALTFGMLGCNLHCGFCQNWVTSQALRDPAAELAGARAEPVSARQVADIARRAGARVVVSSYNEPLITSEWAAAVFREVQAVRAADGTPAGLKCAYVSSGNLTPEGLAYLRPHLAAIKIDLKSMSDRNYRKLGAVLAHVLDGIRLAHAAGLWLEVVTLVIPGFNDSPAELLDAARFLAGVSPDIPWHVTAFHPDYRMTGPNPTAARSLRQAAEIGEEAGLRYVYAGNLPGQVGDYEHTHCPHCRARLIERRGYQIMSYRLNANGACPECGTRVAGVWSTDHTDETDQPMKRISR